MRLIDLDAFRSDYELREHCEECGRYGKKDCDYASYSARDFCGWLDDAPTVPAVPLDKLCEWLAEHYGSPCQLAEIDCYPQCEPDENGECYGMRTDDKRCWHDYLTKWMEGLDAKK